MTSEHDQNDPTSAEADAHADHDAGRMPTRDEERAAETSAQDVELEAVGENYRTAVETGAAVKGEGAIE